MRILLPLALALALPACATMPTGAHIAQVQTAVQRAAAVWNATRASALLWLPFLPVERQAQVTHALAIGDQAIATAQTAATVAEATEALAQVNSAAGTVTTLAR